MATRRSPARPTVVMTRRLGGHLHVMLRGNWLSHFVVSRLSASVGGQNGYVSGGRRLEIEDRRPWHRGGPHECRAALGW